MSHHASLLTLCRSYCETFGKQGAWRDDGGNVTAVQMELDGVRVTLTQDERNTPGAAYVFVDYGSYDGLSEDAEARMWATAMHFNLLLPAGARMRYGRHPSTRGVVCQLVLQMDTLDAYALRTTLQGQVEAAHRWREAMS